MTRREALRRVGLLMGAAVAAPISAGVLGGCRARQPGEAYTNGTLDAGQDALVVALSERIIPETDTPGAKAARVNTFVDAMLTDWHLDEEREEFLAGLALVDERAREATGKAFADGTPEEQDAVVRALDREAFPEDGSRGDGAAADFYRRFKQMTLLGYYTSEVGATQELHVNPMGTYEADIPYDQIGRAWA